MDGKRVGIVGIIDARYLNSAATQIVGVSIRHAAGLVGGAGTEVSTIVDSAIHFIGPDALTVADVKQADAG